MENLLNEIKRRISDIEEALDYEYVNDRLYGRAVKASFKELRLLKRTVKKLEKIEHERLVAFIHPL